MANYREWLSNCCSANHDELFHYDEEFNMGICVQCKDHAEFIDYEEDDIIESKKGEQDDVN